MEAGADRIHPQYFTRHMKAENRLFSMRIILKSLELPTVNNMQAVKWFPDAYQLLIAPNQASFADNFVKPADLLLIQAVWQATRSGTALSASIVWGRANLVQPLQTGKWCIHLFL